MMEACTDEPSEGASTEAADAAVGEERYSIT
jgi:hypothetical protein